MPQDWFEIGSTHCGPVQHCQTHLSRQTELRATELRALELRHPNNQKLPGSAEVVATEMSCLSSKTGNNFAHIQDPFCTRQPLLCRNQTLPCTRLALEVTVITIFNSDLCLQLFGSASHGGLPSEAGAGAWGRCHHNSSNSALPHPFPRQNHPAHPEPVSFDSTHASGNTQSGWCTCSCQVMTLLLVACFLCNIFQHISCTPKHFNHRVMVIVPVYG